jgi:SAM-dependent methyltransferase
MSKLLKKNNREKKAFFYDKLASNKWRDIANFGPSFQSRYRISKKLLKKYVHKESSIYEVGCGSGNFLLQLKNDGYKNLSGSDFSEKTTELAKKKVDCDIHCLNLSKHSVIFDKKKDVVVCLEVLEHIGDDLTVMNNIYHMLAKEGLLIASVPYSMKFWSMHDDFSGHVRRYEPSELEEKLIKSGFSIVESFGWGSFIYPFYHRILSKTNPVKVRVSVKKISKIIKFIVIYLLSYLFYIEELIKTKKRARRIFVVAKKN